MFSGRGVAGGSFGGSGCVSGGAVGAAGSIGGRFYGGGAGVGKEYFHYIGRFTETWRLRHTAPARTRERGPPGDFRGIVRIVADERVADVSSDVIAVDVGNLRLVEGNQRPGSTL